MAQQRDGRGRQGRSPALTLAAAGVGVAAVSYLAWKAYNSQRVAATQAALLRAAATLHRLGAAAGDASASVELVARDLRAFLASDADEVPRSLRQLAKLAAAPEVQDTITACVGAAVRGAAGPATESVLAVLDRLIDAALSERGSSLVALAISVAARDGTASLVASVQNAVTTAMSAPATSVGSGSSTSATAMSDAAVACATRVMEGLASPSGERLLRAVVSAGVGSAVGACMEQARGASPDALSAPLMALLARPEHRHALSELAGAMSGACTREMMAAALAASPPGAEAHEQLQLLAELAQQPQPRLLTASSGRTELEAAVVAELVSRLESSNPLVGGGSCSGSAPPSVADGIDPSGSGLSSPPNGPVTPEPSVAGAPAAPRQPFAASLARRLVESTARRASAMGPAAGQAASAAPALAAPGSWVVAFFAQASQEPELRSLMLEASRCSTREFVRALLPAFWSGNGNGGSVQRADSEISRPSWFWPSFAVDEF